MKLNIEHATEIWKFIEAKVQSIFSDDAASKKQLLACLEGTELSALFDSKVGAVVTAVVKSVRGGNEIKTNLISSLNESEQHRLWQMQKLVDPEKSIFPEVLLGIFLQRKDVSNSANSARALFQDTAVLIANIALLSNIWVLCQKMPEHAQRNDMLFKLMFNQFLDNNIMNTLKGSSSEIQVFLLDKINNMINVVGCRVQAQTQMTPVILALSKNMEFNKIDSNLADKLKNLLVVFTNATDQKFHATIQKNLIAAGKNFLSKIPQQQEKEKKECLDALQSQWQQMQGSVSLVDVKWLEHQILLREDKFIAKEKANVASGRCIFQIFSCLVFCYALKEIFWGAASAEQPERAFENAIALLGISVFLGGFATFGGKNESNISQEVINWNLSWWAQDLKEKLESQQPNASAPSSSSASSSSASNVNNAM